MMQADESFALKTTDLEAAVAAGVIERTTADKLIDFVLKENTLVNRHADEEQLRLITGFNDIFVTIGLALFIWALAFLAASNEVGFAAGGFIIAAASWLLAEVFTRKKRLALPSIALLICFGIFAYLFVVGLLNPSMLQLSALWDDPQYWYLAVAGVVTAGLIALHWLRFRVPITIAVGCAALVVTTASIFEGLFPHILMNHSLFVFVPMGLAIFFLAMRFDISDLARRTRRTDIAFWLHLLAAPLIVHSIVYPLLTEDMLSTGAAIIIVALFATLSFIALAVDRRALLVSSLLYLGYASSRLLSWSGVASENLGLSVLIVGGTVLVLSVAWQPLRRIVLSILPQNVRNLVPPAAAPTNRHSREGGNPTVPGT